MDHPLDGVFAKLDRVEEHLDNLFAEVTTYVENNPYEFIVTDGEEPGLHLIHAYERFAPPLRFAVIFGDVIHNLRRSLDHLAWQLVEANGGNTETA